MRNREPYRFADLARYNTEKAHGILHSPEWIEKMKAEQALFEAEMRAEAEANGWIILGSEVES